MESWIALAEVEAITTEHGFELGEKSFVNVLARADSRSEAEREILSAFAEQGFHVVSLEDLEPWKSRVSSFEVADELIRLERALSDSDLVQFDEFQTWEGQG